MTVCQCVTECVQTWRRCGCVLWLHGESGFLSENKAGNVARAVSTGMDQSISKAVSSITAPCLSRSSCAILPTVSCFQEYFLRRVLALGKFQFKKHCGPNWFTICDSCHLPEKMEENKKKQNATGNALAKGDYPPQGPERTARRHGNVFRQIQGLPGLPECVGARQSEKEAAFYMNLLP